MAKRTTQDLSVGVLFALALVTLGLTVMAVGGDSSLFRRRAEFTVVFPNANGLVAGSPVKMAGVDVGTVTAIHLPTEPGARGIEVEVGVVQTYAERVRQDSRAALRILNFLTFEKAVVIIPGSPGSPRLESGSQIPPEPGTEIFQQAAVSAENLHEITLSLKNILQTMERGEGLLGQMLTDPEFGKEGLDALRGSLINIQSITADLRQGRGFVGRLLQDPSLATRLEEMSGALEGLARRLTDLDLEGGAVGALLAEGGTGEQALDDLRAAAASLRVVAGRLESGEGFLGSLLAQPDDSGQMGRDFAQILHNFAEISEKINRGDGTLGALVNERTLHDGLEDVAAGVNDSKFARWLLRHYRKKGIQASESPAGADEPDDPVIAAEP